MLEDYKRLAARRWFRTTLLATTAALLMSITHIGALASPPEARATLSDGLGRLQIRSSLPRSSSKLSRHLVSACACKYDETYVVDERTGALVTILHDRSIGAAATDRNADLILPLGPDIDIFPPPYTTSPRVLSDPLSSVAVAVDAPDDIWASNAAPNAQTRGDVVEYRNGILSQTLSCAFLFDPAWVAVDRRGNVFVNGYAEYGQRSTVTYVEFPAGNPQSCTVVGGATEAFSPLTYISKMQFTKNGDPPPCQDKVVPVT